MRKFKWAVVVLAAAMAMAVTARAQEGKPDQPVDQEAELAKKLANPIAALISVPLQYNYDSKYGVNDDGKKSVLNIQPVIPFSFGDDWNLITRTILPLVDESDVPPGTQESGIGDILQSFFLSPKQPVGGWIVGAGPVLLYPTASNDYLGGEKWGIGPTVVALQQSGPWTYGVLANHVWSFAGNEERARINSTFVQPFLSYITSTKTTISLNTESTYDWTQDEWSVPVNLMVSQLFKVGHQIMQFGVGARYWADSPDSGPEGFGLRVQLTFLFPK